jgi:hypothetical protein
MAEAREKAFSTSLAPDVGMRVRMIAQCENRSFANVIGSAVKVFTLFPKEVRDILIASASDSNKGHQRIKELSRVLMYREAMRRLDEASEVAAKHINAEKELHDYDDAIVVDRQP